MKTLRLFLGYARNYTGALTVSMISMVLLVGIQLVVPWIIRTMFAAVTKPEAGQIAPDQITHLALMALGVYVVRAVLRFLRSYITHIAGWGVVADIRSSIYAHLQQLSLRFYENKQTGHLMSRMVNDPEMFERLIAHALPDTLVNVLMLAGVSAVLIRLNWQLLLLSLTPVPLILFGMQWYSKHSRPAFRERQEELSALNATLNDNLSGIREIKTFVQEDAEADRIDQHITRFLTSNLKALRLMAITKSPLDNRTNVLLYLCASDRIDSFEARKTCHCQPPSTGHATRKTRIIIIA